MSKNYCGKCGTKLDKNTGLCPKCDVNPTNISGNSNNLSNSSNTKGIPYKKIKKRGNHKEEKRDNNYSFGRRIRHLFFSVLLSAVLLSFIGIVVIGVLCYFDVVDVPVISYALYRSGVVQKIDVERDPQKDNYIPTEETVKYDANKKTYYADNVLLVVFDDSSSDEQISEVVDHLNGVVIGVIPELSMYQIKLSSAFSLDQIESIADDLMNNYDNVIFATYDSATLNANDEIYVPNDPWDKDVDKTDWIDKDVDGSNWWAEAIEARDAWEYNSQLSAIDVGISDSSFDVRHEDLKHKCEFPNELLKSRNVMTPWWHEFDFDIWFHLNKWSVSTQQNYHGTHVAGIIGAEGNNKKGITGLVQNGKILLAPMYPNENSGQYLWWDTSIYANLAYLVKAGAKVINYSQGKTNFLSSTNPSYSQQFLEREGNLAAIAVAKLLEQKYDFIVVQSAGNGTGDAGIAVDAKQNGWFSSITESSITGSKRISISEVRNRVVIVGAAEQENAGYRCTSFSNFGPQVDICAPGSSIYSTVPGELFYDFQFFGGYANECGTSMSAPIVTGVCALTWAANPKLTGEEVKNIVCQNTSVNVATNPNTSDTTTYNLVNAKLAVEASLNQKNESSTKEKGTTDTSLDEKTNPSLVPEDAVNFKGHYYYLYSGGIASSYEKALQFCNSKGASCKI